jgi:hypothetical protein
MDPQMLIIEKLRSGESLVTHPNRGYDVGVRLPGGMTHWFDSEAQARASQYWPRNGGR